MLPFGLGLFSRAASYGVAQKLYLVGLGDQPLSNGVKSYLTGIVG